MACTGLVAKLRLLGVAGMTQATGNVVASVYGILLLVLVVVLLVRAPENSGESIVDSPLVWLALLNLAAVRSPYVGDGYGQVGTLWLLVLTASQQRRTRAQLWVLSLALVLWGVTLEGFAPARPPAWMLVFSIATQLGLIAFNVAALQRTAGRALKPGLRAARGRIASLSGFHNRSRGERELSHRTNDCQVRSECHSNCEVMT